jgi:hypothetical protein
METELSEGNGGSQSSGEATRKLRAKLTERRIALLAAFLFLLWEGVLPFLVYWFGTSGHGFPTVRLDDTLKQTLATSNRIAAILDLFDPWAALVAGLLLYFPAVRNGSSQQQRAARGEIFTGVLNLHILVVGVAAALIPLPWRDAHGVYLVVKLTGHIFMTASWCLAAFHLAEGRLLVPIVGPFVGVVASLPMLFLPKGSGIHGFILDEVPVFILANFAWQLGALLRYRSGFDLFPTGFLPALWRCARIFLPVSVCLWITNGNAHRLVLTDWSSTVYSALSGVESQPFTTAVIAYLVPLAFLVWKDDQLPRRSRRLTYLLFGGYLALNLVRNIVFPYNPNLVGWGVFRHRVVVFYLARLLISPAWQVFVPVVLFWWWVCGRFRRPLVLLVGGYGICLLSLLLDEANFSALTVYPVILSQVVTVVFVFAFLFRHPPLRRQGGI